VTAVPELVLVTDDGPIRTVRMNRAEKKNALTVPMYERMGAAIEGAAAAPGVRCVVIAGAPGAFCAGNDLQDFLAASANAEGLAPPLIRFLNLGDGLAPPGSNRRRQCRGKDEMPATIDQQLPQHTRTTDICSHDTQSLAAGMNRGQHARAQPGLIDAAGASGAEAARGVSFIDNQVRAVIFTQFHQIDQWGPVAVHAEQGFADHE